MLKPDLGDLGGLQGGVSGSFQNSGEMSGLIIVPKLQGMEVHEPVPLLSWVSLGSWLQATDTESFNHVQTGSFWKDTEDSYKLWEAKWLGLNNGHDAGSPDNGEQRPLAKFIPKSKACS